ATKARRHKGFFLRKNNGKRSFSSWLCVFVAKQFGQGPHHITRAAVGVPATRDLKISEPLSFFDSYISLRGFEKVISYGWNLPQSHEGTKEFFYVALCLRGKTIQSKPTSHYSCCCWRPRQ